MIEKSGWLKINNDVYVVSDSSIVRSAYENWLMQEQDSVEPDNGIPNIQFKARTVVVFKRIDVDGVISDIVASSYELPKNLCTVGEMNYTCDSEQLLRFQQIFDYVKLAPGLYIINRREVVDLIYADWLVNQTPRVTAQSPVIVDLDDTRYPVMVSISHFGGGHHIQTSNVEAAQISQGVYRIMSQHGLYQAYDHFNFGRPSIDKLPEGQGADYAYPGIVDFTPNTKPIANWLPTQ